jgi:hypothetical protein
LISTKNLIGDRNRAEDREEVVLQSRKWDFNCTTKTLSLDKGVPNPTITMAFTFINSSIVISFASNDYHDSSLNSCIHVKVPICCHICAWALYWHLAHWGSNKRSVVFSLLFICFAEEIIPLVEKPTICCLCMPIVVISIDALSKRLSPHRLLLHVAWCLN